MAAGCHSLAVVSGSDGSACRVALIWERLAKTVTPLFVKVFCCMRRQQAVYFVVMLLPYQNQPRIGWKPSGNRYNGTYGLQVWKVAQLVEQWIFNLCVPGSIPGFPILLKGGFKIFSLIDTL